MRVRVKICGITRAADAEAAISAGADALGFMFVRASPRFIEPSIAGEIIASLPPFVATVGVFVDEPSEMVRETIATAGVQIAQFHGHETDAQCVESGVPFIKALRVEAAVDGKHIAAKYRHAAAFLLDSTGGSGRTFDWSWWPEICDKPLVLAGGLHMDNVAEAICRTRPFAVDVSTGVEGPSKRVKDPAKMQRFISEVQRAGQRI